MLVMLLNSGLRRHQSQVRKIIGAMENSCYKEVQSVGCSNYEKEVTNKIDIWKCLCELVRKIKESKIPKKLDFPVPQHKEKTFYTGKC